MDNRSISILIVDDEEPICFLLSRLLGTEGFTTMVSFEGDDALKIVQSKAPALMLLDMRMPGLDGMEVMRRAKKIDPDLPVIFITGYADLPGAVEAMRSGAYDYLAKPFDHGEIIRSVRSALAERELKEKLKPFSDPPSECSDLRERMGPGDLVGRIISEVNLVARSDFTVIILGETGSGKELVAKAIHDGSDRSKGPFAAIDCGAIPESLLESELFGHEKGAFTGASIQKPGKFEAAGAGTLFLDEISNMPLSSQAKLLRTLQERKVCRVGGTKAIHIDCRLLVASNQHLENSVRAAHFRNDLFYRLNDFIIRIPPLRERQEDIPYLARRFLSLTNAELNKHVKGFSDGAFDALMTYPWPGNVRELRSVIRRAVLLADETIEEKHFNIRRIPGLAPDPVGKTAEIFRQDLSLKDMVHKNTVAVERGIIARTLDFTGGNKAKAARLLQIDYKTIHTKVKLFGIKETRGKYE